MAKPRIASWIVIQALDISQSNIQDYSIQDAHREAIDLADAVDMVAAQDGETAEVEEMRGTLTYIQGIVDTMKAERDAKWKANGLGVAFDDGFELRGIGSVVQLYKKILRGNVIIDIGGGIDNNVTADTKDWGVTVNIDSNGFNNYAVVCEKLTLGDAIAVYKELPLPTGSGLVQKVYNTWEEAGVTLPTSSPKL